MATQEAAGPIRAMLSFGVNVDQLNDNQWRGECPFCGKEDHFYVNADALFDCKVCLINGNLYDFMFHLWQQSITATQDQHMQELVEHRGISLETLRRWGVCRNFLDQNWIIPMFNSKGSIANLTRMMHAPGNKLQPLHTTGCQIHPYRLRDLQKGDYAWICEGPWDAMRLSQALSQLRLGKEVNGFFGMGNHLIRTVSEQQQLLNRSIILAVPGAGNFQQAWSSYLEGKHVFLMYDNDHPKKNWRGSVQAGWQGMQHAVEAIIKSQTPVASLSVLAWGEDGYDPDLPSGYDVRDCLNDLGEVEGLKKLLSYQREAHDIFDVELESSIGYATPATEPLPCSRFEDLCTAFEQGLHFTPAMKSTLTCMLAVAISTDLKGDQLWLRVIGPPGSGKSTLAECLSASRDYVYSVSVFTGLHSGAKSKDNKDLSLIPHINHKTFIIKDGDTLISRKNLDEILGELRDVYDGTSRTHYRNEIRRCYEDIQTTFILCGTDELRGLNRAFLGDRFLDCEIYDDDASEHYLNTSMNTTMKLVQMSLTKTQEDVSSEMKKLQRLTVGYLKHLKTQLYSFSVPQIEPQVQTVIKAYGEWLAYMRARVRRDKGDMLYRPRAEVATRITNQLTKLGICIALVTQRVKVDKHVLSLLRKIVMDTASSFNLELVISLGAASKYGRNAAELSRRLNLSLNQTQKTLTDLQELGIITKDQSKWKLTPKIQNLWNICIGGKYAL